MGLNCGSSRFQVGACIVNQERKIVGLGYNCMPNKCEKLPWSDADGELNDKHLYGENAAR